MNIVPAKHFDLPQIMNIERASFIPQIQESEKTFEKRLNIFPNGFLLLQDASEQTIKEKRTAQNAGYFCSEIWQTIPTDNDFFTLGHDPAKLHADNGIVLYVSSFALFPEYRGKNLATQFFKDCLCTICKTFPKIKTVLLLVNSEWTGAKKIYKNLGFTKLRILKDFFPSLHADFSDGILMSAPADFFRTQEIESEFEQK
ncbi:N-acetyltransferase [Treponema pectinovorum]|uniref:N-acetyltransferase n=1 Tax=Treponema pectinovorum TaxID=164 RepID=UPI0011CBEEB2|nr:N-acetyltransferase [Treponema pectinovorum]